MKTVPGQSTLTKLRRSARANVRTTVFLLKVLPNLPSRPIDWLTREPSVTTVRYPTVDGDVEGDLYAPGTAGPHPGIAVCLGVVPFGVDHPQVPRLGRALARAGFAALLYWSPAMRDLRLDPDNIEGIGLAYQWLIDQPGVDRSRSGLHGTCVGGSFALLAAAAPPINDRVSFVAAWAPFASMRSLAIDISTASFPVNGVRSPWAVDQLTRTVYVHTLTHGLDPAEADRLRMACAEPTGSLDSSTLSPAGQLIYPLLTTCTLDEAETALANLPEALQRQLERMSPLAVVGDIRARLMLFAHDQNDPVVPIAESRSIVATLENRPGLIYREFVMFKHLDPSKVHLPILALLRELGRFHRFLYPLFRHIS
jgi:hypothetical protein